MKERGNAIRFWIDRRNVWPLFQVAMDASETEVFRVIGAVVLAADDVVDLMWKDRDLFGESAVFAQVSGMAANKFARFC